MLKLKFNKNTNNKVLKWENNKLVIRHSMNYPIAIQMWNSHHDVILYAPIVMTGVETITYGGITIDTSAASEIKLDFNQNGNGCGCRPPVCNEEFMIAIKSVPALNMDEEPHKDVAAAIEALNALENSPSGLAIVFKRQRLESYLDMLVEFDDAYIHSQEESETTKFLMSQGNMDKVRWLSMYTNNWQDVLDSIDANKYKIKLSWKDNL